MSRYVRDLLDYKKDEKNVDGKEQEDDRSDSVGGGRCGNSARSASLYHCISSIRASNAGGEAKKRRRIT